MKRTVLATVLFLLISHTATAQQLAYPPPAEVKQAFLKLLDRPKVPADVQVAETSTSEGFTQQTLSLATEKKADGTIERVPVLLVKPATAGKYPAVIVLHGTGGNKEGQRAWLANLARQGIVGVAIDARYHGARSGGAKGSEAYQQAITRAWRAKPGEPQEHPFYFDTCWDLWRLVDYLVTRDDIDAARLGMIGFSMGGIQTWLAAAVDERIKVAVPAIAAQSYRWSLENDAWQARARTIKAAHDAAAADLGEKEVNQRVCRELWNKIIPGMLDQFDCPSMIRLFAGESAASGTSAARPLLILSGELDPNCPLGGAKLAFAQAEAAYRSAGKSDLLAIDVAASVAHKVTDEQHKMALDWFVRWLK